MGDQYKLKYITGRKLTVFLAVADRIVPPDDEGPGAGTMATAGVVDWAMERMPVGLRGQVLALLLGLDALGLFFGLRPFTRNSASARDRQLAWMESCPLRPLRLGFFGLKSYVCMGYYSREDIWPTIGYEGPLRPEREYPDPVIRALCKGEMEVVS
jgi:hypothetical protein